MSSHRTLTRHLEEKGDARRSRKTINRRSNTSQESLRGNNYPESSAAANQCFHRSLAPCVCVCVCKEWLTRHWWAGFLCWSWMNAGKRMLMQTDKRGGDGPVGMTTVNNRRQSHQWHWYYRVAVSVARQLLFIQSLCSTLGGFINDHCRSVCVSGRFYSANTVNTGTCFNQLLSACSPASGPS